MLMMGSVVIGRREEGKDTEAPSLPNDDDGVQSDGNSPRQPDTAFELAEGMSSGSDENFDDRESSRNRTNRYKD